MEKKETTEYRGAEHLLAAEVLTDNGEIFSNAGIAEVSQTTASNKED